MTGPAAIGVAAPAPARAPTEAQRRAADPGLSAFVAASAGSGKTQVLTDRVLRLLLSGAAPSRILCITYTKAGAGEMANRVVDRLARLATASSADRVALLRLLLDRDPTQAELVRATRLFADVLDTPGGLKIQTIHAFCQSVLGRFPLEADLAPHFSVIDERVAQELLTEAVRMVMRAPGGPAEVAALALITEQTHETQLGPTLRGLVGSTGKLRVALAEHGGPAGLAAHIRRLLGVGPDETEDHAWAALVRDPAMDEDGLRHAGEVLLEWGKPSARDQGRGLLAFLSLSEGLRIEQAPVYVNLWLTNDRTPRKDSGTAAAFKADPGVADIVAAERERVYACWQHLCAVRIAEATAALVVVAERVTAAYERLKQARAGLDYDDLIARMRTLLRAKGRAAWVLFKLDGGLDHLLIDEAQDTNYPQWDIVADLTEDFFAGDGSFAPADDSTVAGGRSIFAVGDAKQSIYSFQGADPGAFDAARELFSGRVRGGRRAWAEVPLDLSFRSAAAVLAAVDAVSNTPAARQGLDLSDGEALRHRVSRTGEAGLVELWPLIAVDDADDRAGEPGRWHLPVEPEPGDSPKAMLAKRVAGRIKRMVGHELLESRGRPVRAGDILVLVRQRDALVEELIRQLKECGVSVAGRDRLKLTEHLAVMDLIALGEVMLLPEDDLKLATVLKSPLVGYDEDALYEVAHGRDGDRLWRSLQRRAQADPGSRHGHAFAWLESLRALVDYQTPFVFFDRVLNDTRDPAQGGRAGLSGRARLIARLGHDAADPIDELLALAQGEERSYPPSMQGFLFRLRTSDIDIKREFEQSGADAVRVMTVHGAKGLQAPIVFLPDTVSLPMERDPVRWYERDGQGAVPLWLRDRSLDDPVSAAARAQAARRAADEYHRLLYVAMTRAEDRLYIAGAHGARSPSDGCWYRLIEAGLAGLLTEADDPEIGAVGRLACPQERPAAVPQAEPAQPQPEPLPAWVHAPAPPEPRPPRPLAPSRPDETDAPASSPLERWAPAGPSLARERGVAAHVLLQRLPDLPPDRRRAAALGWLGRSHPAWPEASRTALAGEVLAILDHPDFAALFGPGSLAEAPLVAVLDGGQVVAGQVDRLLVRADQVLVVDYKTNRRPPASVEAVPPVYLRQMAAYRAALSRMFAGRGVACALLWTDGPLLMPLPAALLDRALPLPAAPTTGPPTAPKGAA